jgi:transposase
MLRRVRVEGMSVTDAAESFGVSRVTFYQALEAFQAEGLPGLLPRRRGPKAASKLTDAVLAFIDRQRAADPSLRAPELAEKVQEHLSLSVHPRSIERALARRAKRGQSVEPA